MPGVRSMYSKADAYLTFASSGTTPSISVTISGEVPQDTIGSTSLAFIFITLSTDAFLSELSIFQYLRAFSRFSPEGAKCLSFK